MWGDTGGAGCLLLENKPKITVGQIREEPGWMAPSYRRQQICLLIHRGTASEDPRSATDVRAGCWCALTRDTLAVQVTPSRPVLWMTLGDTSLPDIPVFLGERRCLKVGHEGERAVTHVSRGPSGVASGKASASIPPSSLKNMMSA